MVFFVCEGCNETLKKGQVDGHAKKCRSCNAVTCIDCSVTFYGNDYDMHISCVSEAEKYEKSLYKGKKVKLNPQDAWMQLISLAASKSSSAPTDVKPYLERLSEQSNVPRNKKKFCNFIKNSMSLRNDKLIDKIWSHLESVRISNKQEDNDGKNQKVSNKKQDNETVGNSNSNDDENDNDDNKEKKKKKKKRDREIELDDNNNDYNNDDDKGMKKKAKKAKKEKEEVKQE